MGLMRSPTAEGQDPFRRTGACFPACPFAPLWAIFGVLIFAAVLLLTAQCPRASSGDLRTKSGKPRCINSSLSSNGLLQPGLCQRPASARNRESLTGVIQHQHPVLAPRRRGERDDPAANQPIELAGL